MDAIKLNTGITYFIGVHTNPIQFINQSIKTIVPTKNIYTSLYSDTNSPIISNENLDLTNMNEFVEPAKLLLTLSSYKYDEDDEYDEYNKDFEENKNYYYSTLLGKRIHTTKSTGSRNSSISNRPTRTTRTTCSNSPILSNENIFTQCVQRPNKKIRSRYSNTFVRGDRVRILKNLNDYKYYDYTGIITDMGNGFYSVDINGVSENCKFRGFELEPL
jgi:hypothetical protein